MLLMVHFLTLNTSYAIWLTIMNDLLCHPALFPLPSLQSCVIACRYIFKYWFAFHFSIMIIQK